MKIYNSMGFVRYKCLRRSLSKATTAVKIITVVGLSLPEEGNAQQMTEGGLDGIFFTNEYVIHCLCNYIVKMERLIMKTNAIFGLSITICIQLYN